ncbi:MAG: ribonuclease PH [Fimbriimonadales bacterium]
MARPDGRKPEELRPLSLHRGYLKYAEGSCLIELGNTRVLCAASIEDRVPSFLKGSGSGWVTAEYNMLPRACLQRTPRERERGAGGRTQEIQRLIGRSLRSVVDMEGLGERTITVDCDVIQGDGGTRTASITGAYIALADALGWLRERGLIGRSLLVEAVAAISVGVVMGIEMLDLNYEEDSQAAVDMNVVMTESGKFVEIQGTAEHAPFTEQRLARMLHMAQRGIEKIIEVQRECLATPL